jgi:hypothetical protein
MPFLAAVAAEFFSKKSTAKPAQSLGFHLYLSIYKNWLFTK